MNTEGIENRKQVRFTRKHIRNFRKHRRVLKWMYRWNNLVGLPNPDPLMQKAQLDSLQGMIDTLKAQIKNYRERQTLLYKIGQELAQIPWW